MSFLYNLIRTRHNPSAISTDIPTGIQESHIPLSYATSHEGQGLLTSSSWLVGRGYNILPRKGTT